MITIDKLTVQFGGVNALNEVCLELRAPVVGIIGPNGAGKTTLLNAFSGFVAPSGASRIAAEGVELLTMTPAARARWGVRRSFQSEQVVDDLSVGENVQVMLDSSDLSRAERAAALHRALAFVGLLDQRDRPGGSLDAFERRLVELARAVAGRPRIVLLDEPGGGLSGSEVERLRDVIGRIHAEFDAITLLIDHDVTLIAAVCVETVVLDFGTLIAHGPTAQVLADARVRSAYLGEEGA
ncbi:MAG: ABC transporter ATP-binding protein [Rhizobiales bacterium]|nr:ABC transporter ATP-binding protein [Rhizobacter sp.]